MTSEPISDTVEESKNSTVWTRRALEVIKNKPLYFLIPLVLIVIAQVIFIIVRKKLNGSRPKYRKQHSNCTSDHCIRCNKYDATRDKSIKLLTTYKDKILKDEVNSEKKETKKLHSERVEEIKRISDALTITPVYDAKRKQNPNVLSIDGLDTEPFWNDNKFERVEEILEKNYQTILTEFRALPTVSHWTENNTPHGSWRAFHLVNQGQVQKENCALVPETMKLINSLPGLMKYNVFGNVYFSEVDPGTWITPHYGPCNSRIRCHLGLITTPHYHLIVDGVRRRSWRSGRCLFFDDSFLHEVRYLDDTIDGSPREERPASSLGTAFAKRQKSRLDDYSNRLSRAVLIIDLWHPDLTAEEIDALNYIFPASDHSYEEWKADKKQD